PLVSWLAAWMKIPPASRGQAARRCSPRCRSRPPVARPMPAPRRTAMMAYAMRGRYWLVAGACASAGGGCGSAGGGCRSAGGGCGLADVGLDLVEEGHDLLAREQLPGEGERQPRLDLARHGQVAHRAPQLEEAVLDARGAEHDLGGRLGSPLLDQGPHRFHACSLVLVLVDLDEGVLGCFVGFVHGLRLSNVTVPDAVPRIGRR